MNGTGFATEDSFAAAFGSSVNAAAPPPQPPPTATGNLVAPTGGCLATTARAGSSVEILYYLSSKDDCKIVFYMQWKFPFW